MNDLLQLRQDFNGRYEDTVECRRSLRDMKTSVHTLTTKLEENADHIIRPDNAYWAALSNSIAGVVEAATEILDEAMSVAEMPWIIRWFVNFCTGGSFDKDVREITTSFIRIEDAVLASDRDMNVQEKMSVFQHVNSFNSSLSGRRLSRMLSNILEESESDNEPQHQQDFNTTKKEDGLESFEQLRHYSSNSIAQCVT